MKRYLAQLLTGGIGITVAAIPVVAHHSFAAQYDPSKPVTIKGTVTKVEWMNPHIYLYLVVTDETGKVTPWEVEGGPPNQLYRNGWRKDTVKAGDVLTIEGFRARDGSDLVNMRNAIMPDGRRVLGGQSDGGPDAGRGRRGGGPGGAGGPRGLR